MSPHKFLKWLIPGSFRIISFFPEKYTARKDNSQMKTLKKEICWHRIKKKRRRKKAFAVSKKSSHYCGYIEPVPLMCHVWLWVIHRRKRYFSWALLEHYTNSRLVTPWINTPALPCVSFQQLFLFWNILQYSYWILLLIISLYMTYIVLKFLSKDKENLWKKIGFQK